MDFQDLTLAEAAGRIEARELSPVELTRAYLDRIDRLDPELNTFVTLTREKALEDAVRAEADIAAGRYRGALHGIPVSIKDSLATAGVRTTAGSKHLSDWIPDEDATVVARLKQAGAVILGKTNMHEWAAGCTTINPYYGTTRNPWDRNRVSGGSSGGSAASVAAGLALGSIGTDNAGSVRNPASLCGVVGLKATYGRVSRVGGVAGTGGYSTDHFGVLTRTVRDSALMLQAIAGPDPRDPLSSDVPVPDFGALLGEGVAGLRVGIIRDYFDDLAVDEVKGRRRRRWSCWSPWACRCRSCRSRTWSTSRWCKWSPHGRRTCLRPSLFCAPARGTTARSCCTGRFAPWRFPPTRTSPRNASADLYARPSTGPSSRWT